MRVCTSKDCQKEGHHFHAEERDLTPGKKVYAKNFRNGPHWLP